MNQGSITKLFLTKKNVLLKYEQTAYEKKETIILNTFIWTTLHVICQSMETHRFDLVLNQEKLAFEKSWNYLIE